MQYSIFSIAALAVSVVVVALFVPLIYRETLSARATDRRLAILRDQAVGPARVSVHRHRRDARMVFRTIGQAFVRAGSMLMPVGAAERDKLAQLLRKGGFAQREALSIFLTIKLVSALGLGICAGVLAATLEMINKQDFLLVLVAFAGLVVGGVIPEYCVRAIVARRVRRLISTLPDALDMMVMCLEAGLTVERGFMTVAESLAPIEPTLAKEFRQLEVELRLGSDRRTVLQDYYRRTDIDGLRDLAMALIQSDRYGTPLSQSMKSIASDERLQKTARIIAQAERLPVLMTLPMLLFVVPGTVLLVAGPAFLLAISGMSKLS